MAIGTRVIQTCLLPRNWSFAAITIFGLVFTPDKRRVDRTVRNHELIHCQQQLEWLYLPFFILYFAEWIWYMLRYRDNDRAYRSISFEREAYRYENDKDYIARRRHYANYRKLMEHTDI